MTIRLEGKGGRHIPREPRGMRRAVDSAQETSDDSQQDRVTTRLGHPHGSAGQKPIFLVLSSLGCGGGYYCAPHFTEDGTPTFTKTG